MPTASIDGITTRYEVVGSGQPVLMFAPGGFDASLEQWTRLGVYARTKLLELLSGRYMCIIFDRRECGASGGRVERVTWSHFAAQGRGLLDHLNIQRAHLLGGCMGCGPAMAFAVAHPYATLSLVLYCPVGGAKYRISGYQRFAGHLTYVQQHGLEQVVRLVTEESRPFSRDARGGPWASVIRHDRIFADSFVRKNLDDYKLIVVGMARALFDRDTAPGAEPEDLLRHPRVDRSGPGRLARDFGGEISRRMSASLRILGRHGCRSDRGNCSQAAPAIPRYHDRAVIIDLPVHHTTSRRRLMHSATISS